MLREPILFGDYRNSLTGEARVYEDVVDYEAAKAVFEEVGELYVTYLKRRICSETYRRNA